MANPQKEDGYTTIANELLDAIIAFRIPGELRQVLDAIIRKTYGFNKKADAIANSQIAECTKMKKQNVSRSLARLIEHKLVIKTDSNSIDGHILKINKDYSQWISFVIKTDNKTKLKKKSSKLITTVIRSDDKASSEVMDTKDKRKLKDKYRGEDEIEQARFVRDIIEAFSFLNPACKRMYGNTAQRQACSDLIETYTFDKTMFIIKNTLPKTNQIAYFPTILTPHQLFLEWARLEAAVMKYKSKVEIKNQEKGRGLA